MSNYLDANATGLAQMLWIFGGLTVLFLIAGVFQLCFWLARRIDASNPRSGLDVERFHRISEGRARQAAARDAVADQEWREEIARRARWIREHTWHGEVTDVERIRR